jgi:hypothetical protein
VGLSILFSWLYNVSGGGLIPVILLHTSFNSSVIVILGPAMATGGTRPLLALTFGVWVSVAALLALIGPNLSMENG